MDDDLDDLLTLTAADVDAMLRRAEGIGRAKQRDETGRLLKAMCALNGDGVKFLTAYEELSGGRLTKGFDPNEKRDDGGKWADGGAGWANAPWVPLRKGFDPAKHPHADHGYWAKNGEHGHADPDEHARSLASRIKEVPAKLAQRVALFIQAKYLKLADRYGPTGAKAVLGAMVLLTPVPLPGTSLLPIALAEAVLRIRQAVKGGVEKAMPGLTPEQVLALAQDLLHELTEEMGDVPVMKAVVHAPPGGVSVGGKRYPGGEFIPGDVVAEATPEEKEKIQGGEAPKEVPEKAGGAARRAKAIADAAAQIEVTDDRVSGDEVDGSDYDEIADRMTDDEREEMQSALDGYRDDWVNEQMGAYDPDDDDSVDEAVAADMAGWSDKGVQVKALALIDDLENADEVRDAAEAVIDKWYRRTSKSGEDAVDELADRLGDEDDLSELADAVRAMSSDARDETEEKLEGQREEVKEVERARLERKYDDEDDRRDYLREFYRGHDERFQGAKEKDKWGTDEDGDPTFLFGTANGGEFKVSVFDQNHAGHTVPELVFSDADGKFKVTGAGGAHEVFSKVSAAATALVTKKKMPALSFTAAEESRQKLYDRLVRTVASAAPEYAAVAVTPPKGPKRYLVVLRDQLEKMSPALISMAGAVETLVKAVGPKLPRGVELLGSASDRDVTGWSRPDAWPEEPDEPDDGVTPEEVLAAAIDHLSAVRAAGGANEDAGPGLAALHRMGATVGKGFDPNEPRDHGKWTTGGGLPAPDSYEACERIAGALRDAVAEESGGDTKDWCITTAEALRSVYPDAEVWSGGYEGFKDDQAHTVVKLGGHFIDVTADQFGGPEVHVTGELDIDKYPDFRREPPAPAPKPAKGSPAYRIAAALKAALAEDGATVEKAARWRHDLHPRGDDGRFVPKGVITRAAKDPAFADKARAKITNPEERQKFDDAVAGDTHESLLGTDKELAAHHEREPRAKAKGAKLASRDEARRLRDKLSLAHRSGEPLDPKDLRALIPHLTTLTHAELSKVRQFLAGAGASFNGTRLREERVAALVKWASGAAIDADNAALPPYSLFSGPRQRAIRDGAKQDAGVKVAEATPPVDSIAGPSPGEHDATPETLPTDPLAGATIHSRETLPTGPAPEPDTGAAQSAEAHAERMRQWEADRPGVRAAQDARDRAEQAVAAADAEPAAEAIGSRAEYEAGVKKPKGKKAPKKPKEPPQPEPAATPAPGIDAAPGAGQSGGMEPIPAKLYRGGAAAALDQSKVFPEKDHNAYGPGVYLGSDPEQAARYGDVQEFAHAIENPARFAGRKDYDAQVDAYAREHGIDDLAVARVGFNRRLHARGHDAIAVKDKQGRHEVIALNVSKLKAPPAATPDRLAADPGADRRALAALRDQHPAGSKARDYLETAAHNTHQPDTDVDGPARRRDTVKQLAELHRAAHTAGDHDTAGHVASALQHFGAGLHGPAEGETVPFDGRYHESDHPAFTGDPVQVTRRPVVMGEHVAVKGRVGKATEVAKPAASGDNAPVPPAGGGPPGGGKKVGDQELEHPSDILTRVADQPGLIGGYGNDRELPERLRAYARSSSGHDHDKAVRLTAGEFLESNRYSPHARDFIALALRAGGHKVGPTAAEQFATHAAIKKLGHQSVSEGDGAAVRISDPKSGNTVIVPVADHTEAGAAAAVKQAEAEMKRRKRETAARVRAEKQVNDE